MDTKNSWAAKVASSTHIVVKKGKLVGFARFHGYGKRTRRFWTVVSPSPWREAILSEGRVGRELVRRGEAARSDAAAIRLAVNRLFEVWGLPINALGSIVYECAGRGLSEAGACTLIEALEIAESAAREWQLAYLHVDGEDLALTGREHELLSETWGDQRVSPVETAERGE